MQANREILHEGWLVKSPPTKRILRARWRRRWFALKQGEIPGQFCLEYYTDRNCRKLKGVIDLDQCEQVDSGLRLEHRKQKFQYMFDIKTPRRTYYLAADTENDMKDWVNCICQVCNLHESCTDRAYYNLLPSPTATPNIDNKKLSPSVLIENKSKIEHIHRNSIDNEVNCISDTTNELSIREELYQNQSEMAYVNTEILNKSFPFNEKNLNSNNSPKEKSERSLSFNQQKDKNLNSSIKTKENKNSMQFNHTRSKSEQISTNIALSNSGGAIKKRIPENLVLTTSNNEDTSGNVEPSPALSTSSGPYIPLSQCFSGSPKYINNNSNQPTTPLNNLDPKFVETPRNNHLNFGPNLTSDQSYSPKISNFMVTKSKSGQSSPTDSESVFTDEDESTYRPSRNNSDRRARPSDSSVENDLIVFSYDQRFSKFQYENSNEQEKCTKCCEEKLCDEHFSNPFQIKEDNIKSKTFEERNNSKDVPQFSDTENTSPAAFAVNTSAWVADQRTQQYCNMNNQQIAASTPNLYSENQSKTMNSMNNIQCGTLPRSNPFMNIERNEETVFRYDFIEKGKLPMSHDDNNLPPVNRDLKPKSILNITPNSIQSKSTNMLNRIPLDTASPKPPSIDRTLKPSTKSSDSPNRRSHVPTTTTNLSSEFSPSPIGSFNDMQTHTLPRSNQSFHHANSPLLSNFNVNNNQAIYNNNNIMLQNISSGNKSLNSSLGASNSPLNLIQKLEYCDLEITNGPCTPAPAISANRSSIISTISQQSIDSKTPPKSNTVYRSIDFEKTRVLNQIREDTQGQGRTRRKDN